MPPNMPPTMMKALTDVAARNAQPKARPYKLSAGGGLYLEVAPNGAKYWRMKYRFAGREKRLAITVWRVEDVLALIKRTHDTDSGKNSVPTRGR